MELPRGVVYELQVLNAIKEGRIVYCSEEEKEFTFNVLKHKVREDIFNIMLDAHKFDFNRVTIDTPNDDQDE